MTAHIVSGYFATFHEGHKEYIESVVKQLKDDDYLIVIIANKKQFRLKYNDYEPADLSIIRYPIYELLANRNIPVYFEVASDTEDTTICKTLEHIIKERKADKYILYKDGGEYNKKNLPEKDVKGIEFVFLKNKKIASASNILNIEKRGE